MFDGKPEKDHRSYDSPTAIAAYEREVSVVVRT